MILTGIPTGTRRQPPGRPALVPVTLSVRAESHSSHIALRCG